jgi:hypothetical protein
MPTYEIEQYEIYVLRHRVEADNEADAVSKLFMGEGDPIDNSLAFINIADDLGMSLCENPDLASQLFDRGVIDSSDKIISSIRSIKQVELQETKS